MSLLLNLLVPLILAAVALTGLRRGVDVYEGLSTGALEGLRILLRIFPSLVGLLTAVYMLRASGLLDAMAQVLAPGISKMLWGMSPVTKHS